MEEMLCIRERCDGWINFCLCFDSNGVSFVYALKGQ